jgi:hypothetical protein
MNSEQFQRIADLLSEIARTIAIIAVAGRMAEATTDEEKIYLSQSMTALMNDQQSPRIGEGNSGHSPYVPDPTESDRLIPR